MSAVTLTAEYLALNIARRWGDFGYSAADRIADLTGMAAGDVDHLLARASLADITERRRRLDAITLRKGPR